MHRTGFLRRLLPVCLLAAVLLGGVCLAAGDETAVSPYYSTFWALVPPLVAIGLAIITKEVYSSLFIGTLLGGLLVTSFHPVKAVDVVLENGILAAISDTAGIFAFLVMLGIIVALVNKAGGSAAFGAWARTHIKSRTGAALATFALGVLIFIDDYFNCLTVGSVMRPVTDSHRISRAKLSYLIDATAAPICMIAPVSSWAATVSKYAEEGKGIQLFIQAIPYNYYSLLTLVFIVALVLLRVDYGPMRLHERNAMEKGDLFTGGQLEEETVEEINGRGRVIDLLLPVAVLIVVCIIGLVYAGGFFSGLSFVDAFSRTNVSVGLPWGSLLALVFTIIYLALRRVVSFREAMDCIPKGFIAMVPAILILTFATALKNLTGMLGAAEYVHGVMQSAAPGLANFLPAIIFLVSCVLAFASGSSWSTFGILIPIVTAIFAPGSELLIVGISACLAGAVCGDHCSPISDTTIMSAAGAQCNLLSHVTTQLPYAVTVAAVSFGAYLLTAFVQNPLVVLPIGAAAIVGVLLVIKGRQKRENA